MVLQDGATEGGVIVEVVLQVVLLKITVASYSMVRNRLTIMGAVYIHTVILKR